MQVEDKVRSRIIEFEACQTRVGALKKELVEAENKERVAREELSRTIRATGSKEYLLGSRIYSVGEGELLRYREFEGVILNAKTVDTK